MSPPAGIAGPSRATPPSLVISNLAISDATSSAGSVANNIAVVEDHVLDERAIRRSLPAAPAPKHDVMIAVDIDESASVSGGNDAIGHRHELLKIALTHLATRRVGRRWHIRISTFDERSSIDLPTTRLDRAGLEDVRRALSSTPAGGSSILGPSLRSAERHLTGFKGPRLLVVLSDFELFDPSPAEVIDRLVTSSAHVVQAISLGNEPPMALQASRARTACVRAGDEPVVLARLVIDAALAVTTSSRKEER